MSRVDLQPHTADPLILRWCSETARARGAIVATIPLGLACMLILGELLENGGERTCSIARTLLEQVSFAIGGAAQNVRCWSNAGEPNFRFASDPLSSALMLTLAACVLTARAQWLGYARVISALRHSGALVFRNRSERKKFEGAIHEANQLLATYRWVSLAVAGISILLVVLFARGQASEGIYPELSPGGSSTKDWVKAAFQSWWLNGSADLKASFLYYFLGTLALYLVTMQNLVGLTILWILWRNRNLYQVGADPLNSDGYYGWSPIRAILTPTYLQISAHGLALAILLTQTVPGSGTYPALVATFGQWLITLPFYLIWPLAITAKKVRAFKERELSRLAKEATKEKHGRSNRAKVAIEAAYAARIDQVRKIPSLPYGGFRSSALFLMAAMADASAVYYIFAR